MLSAINFIAMLVCFRNAHRSTRLVRFIIGFVHGAFAGSISTIGVDVIVIERTTYSLYTEPMENVSICNEWNWKSHRLRCASRAMHCWANKEVCRLGKRSERKNKNRQSLLSLGVYLLRNINWIAFATSAEAEREREEPIKMAKTMANA